MTRISIALAAAVLVAPAGAIAHATASPPALERYVVQMNGQIGAYRRLLRQFDRLFSEEPRVNVDPYVACLYRLADRFEDLTVRWSDIPAVHGLRARHRGMARAFDLFAEAIRIHAGAVFTRHRDEIVAALARVLPRIRSASYLQKRWAGALEGALIRAELRVPGWMHGMANIEP